MSDPVKRVTAAGGVASPCTSVCRIDQRSGLCAGCLRTLDEIVSWSLYSDGEKAEVMAALHARRGRSTAGSDGRG